jgi:hypothetical protein
VPSVKEAAWNIAMASASLPKFSANSGYRCWKSSRTAFRVDPHSGFLPDPPVDHR